MSIITVVVVTAKAMSVGAVQGTMRTGRTLSDIGEMSSQNQLLSHAIAVVSAHLGIAAGNTFRHRFLNHTLTAPSHIEYWAWRSRKGETMDWSRFENFPFGEWNFDNAGYSLVERDGEIFGR